METDLHTLWIWKESQDLAQIIYEEMKKVHCDFPLKNQIDRSSQSVCDNISEMFGAYYYKVKLNTLRISRKEAYETINHLEKIKRRKLVSTETSEALTNRYGRLIAGINNYLRYIETTKNKTRRKGTDANNFTPRKFNN
jgi:four helix bundle protein